MGGSGDICNKKNQKKTPMFSSKTMSLLLVQGLLNSIYVAYAWILLISTDYKSFQQPYVINCWTFLLNLKCQYSISSFNATH